MWRVFREVRFAEGSSARRARPGQESECGTGLFRVAPTKARTEPHFRWADGQVAVPSTHDAHRSPWGNLGLLPGAHRSRPSTETFCSGQHSRELFRYLNCPG